MSTPVVVDVMGRGLATPLRLHGRVVSSLPAAVAFARDVPAGMGIEFHSLNPAMRHTMLQLIGLEPSEVLSASTAELVSIRIL